MKLTGAAILVSRGMKVLQAAPAAYPYRSLALVNRGMWYLAEILFAEPQRADRQAYQCEACNVVFDAATAREAYDKAKAWGESYAAEPPVTMQLLGVSHLTTIGDRLGDGIEICGRFFETKNPWDGGAELIPAPASLKAIVWEQNQDTPLGELLTPEQIAALRRTI
jgi:hypothetical protein